MVPLDGEYQLTCKPSFSIFSRSFRFSDISISNSVTLKKYTTSYMMAILMIDLSLTIYKIFANQIKCKKFDLKYGGQGQGGENNWTCAIRLEMFDSLLLICS